MKPFFALLLLLALACASTLGAVAGTGIGNNSAPTPPPTSAGSASIVLNTLEAGAGGTYTPLTSNKILPMRRDITNPIHVPPPPDPQGKPCPTMTLFHIRPMGGVNAPPPLSGSVVSVMAIYPTFVKNAAGGYDGIDAQYGYDAPNAIPAGGNPADAALGSPATAATIGGHVIAVGAFLEHLGFWQDATPGVAPYGGSCQGASFAFGTPYLAGDAPPPVPPASVLNRPPFVLGSALMAEVTGRWRIGSIQTLPGPQPNARTYVHIPTCAWLDTGVPQSTVALHAVKSVIENGVTLFLVYNLTVQPEATSWSWGDGQWTTDAVATSPPQQLPTYDPTSQTWTDPCAVSHAYATVSDGRTITATQVFSVNITVSWNDGVADHTAPVACDLGTGGPCVLTIGPASGWSSGPHPVDQIEPVPLIPPTSSP